MVENRSVIKVLRVVEYLAAQRDGVGLTRLARDLRMDHSTAHRFLATLRSNGYVRQREDGAYQLTLKLAAVGARLLDGFDIRSAAAPYLRELTSDTRLSSQLAVLDGTAVSCLDSIEPDDLVVSLKIRPGHQFSVHSSAYGKVIAAHLPVSERMELLDRISLVAHTQSTITQRTALERALGEARAAGSANDDEEDQHGIRAVAAPIFDMHGGVIAAIGLAGLTLTIPRDRLPSLGASVRTAAASLSAELGFATGRSLDEPAEGLVAAARKLPTSTVRVS
jgi:DNA-binding IclR family transcriptional regulator